MNDATIIGASAIVALLALVTAAIAWVSKIRSDRHHRLALDEATRTRDKQIQSLEQQIDFLRQLEAVKFVERYIATRRGLQQRLDRLAADVEAGHAREREIEREIRELSLSDEDRSADVQRLRAELSRNQQEAHRLEQAIDAVYSIGEIQVDEVRREVARRRRLAVELKGRIERLGLDSEAKVAEVARLKGELESGRESMEALKRELDLTRSAGPIVDGLLGIDEELADRVDDIDHNLAQAGLDLGANADAEMVGHFLAVVERERSQRGRLLGAGAGAEAAAPAGDREAHAPSRAAATDDDVPPALAEAVARTRAGQTEASIGAGQPAVGAGERGVGAEPGVGAGDPGASARGAGDPGAGARGAGDPGAGAGDPGAGARDADAARAEGDAEDLEEDPWDAVTSDTGNGAHREVASRPKPERPKPERRPVPVPGPVVAESTPAEEESRPEAEPPEPRVWY